MDLRERRTPEAQAKGGGSRFHMVKNRTGCVPGRHRSGLSLFSLIISEIARHSRIFRPLGCLFQGNTAVFSPVHGFWPRTQQAGIRRGSGGVQVRYRGASRPYNGAHTS